MEARQSAIGSEGLRYGESVGLSFQGHDVLPQNVPFIVLEGLGCVNIVFLHDKNCQPISTLSYKSNPIFLLFNTLTPNTFSVTHGH